MYYAVFWDLFLEPRLLVCFGCVGCCILRHLLFCLFLWCRSLLVVLRGSE